MDLSHAPQAIAMTAKEFQEWSSNFVVETMKTSGAKVAIDRMTAPIWAWVKGTPFTRFTSVSPAAPSRWPPPPPADGTQKDWESNLTGLPQSRATSC